MLAILWYACALAEQSTPYILTEFPVIAMSAESKIWVKWTGASSKANIMEYPAEERYPDSGIVYFSKSPGGGEIENYTDSITVFAPDSTFAGIDPETGDSLFSIQYQNSVPFEGLPPQRGVCFRPKDQRNMGPGVYYYMVAWRTTITNTVAGMTVSTDTTWYSNELKMVVESDVAPEPVSPALDADITDLTPTFSWKKNPGVPYYHIIVSDEKINPDIENESIEGLSIVWQAITANTSITYGAPDPSKTITADPPPVSPGQTYSWVVLNNYGNHPAYTSQKFGLPQTFNIIGEALETPRCVFPADGDTIDALTDSLVFKWTNLDQRANTYKIYVYVASDFEGVDAQLVMWEDEVMADAESENDTMSLEIDAANVFTNNYYTWKAIAVDSRGAGSTGEINGFTYKGIPMGDLKIHTRETIVAGGSTLEENVAAVKIEVEVLDGSMEAPLLFYTDNNGNLSRSRPAGSYRITAIKDGFETATRSITIREDETTELTLYLERPASTLYGRIMDEAQRPIDLGTVTGVSDRGDTIRAESDALGNFVLNCYEADWSVWAGKKGYVSSAPRDTTVRFGQSVNLKTFNLKKNAYVLSGAVNNQDGKPLIAARIELLREGAVLDENPSTSQSGSFSFSVEPGSYTIKATKTGFVTQQIAVDVFGSKQITVTLPSGAALVKGKIFGASWGEQGRVYAPVTSATIRFIDADTASTDTFETVSDWAYGDYQISLPGNREYIMYAAAEGSIGRFRNAPVSTVAGKTQTENDTLTGLASIGGTSVRSEDVKAVNGVEVVLIDTVSGKLAASSRSDASGVFEIRGIADGVYNVRAGKKGYVLDSIHLRDTAGQVLRDSILEIVDGRAVKIESAQVRIIDAVTVKLEPGEKSLIWVVQRDGVALSDAAIKVESPLRTTLRAGDTLSGVGPGAYQATFDADADSLLDCVARMTVLPDTEDTVYFDSVTLPVTHRFRDSIAVEKGAVTLTLRSTAALDSARIFYRPEDAADVRSMREDSTTESGGVSTCHFSFVPRKNGAMLVYYFEAYIDDYRYGYDKEAFRTYVRPDTTTLSRIMVVPGGDDTLSLPAGAEISFVFQGFYGSRFQRDTRLVDEDVRWRLLGGEGCWLNRKNKTSADGLAAAVLTPAGSAAGVFMLEATLDTSRRDLKPGLSPTVSIPFTVKDRLDSIYVRRVDKDETHVTTASSDRAEFVAEGLTAKGVKVTVTAQWRIRPESAGVMTEAGVFDPAADFIGRVSVIASVDDIVGYFNVKTGDQSAESGLGVHYYIPVVGDSVSNRAGITISFPDSVVSPADDAELELSSPILKNRNFRAPDSLGFIMIGDAYDINELNGVPLQVGADSIRLRLSVPEEYRDDARNDASMFSVGLWNEDSLCWERLAGSTVSDDGSDMIVHVGHFSRYAVLYKKTAVAGALSVYPNPFSPYVQPVHKYGDAYKSDLPFGACFEITPKSNVDPLDVTLDVYNVKGEHVLFARLINPEPNRRYHLWWDGRTSHEYNKEVKVEKINDHALRQKTAGGSVMCRNGRYFAVITVKDGKGNRTRKMKQVVLIK